VAARRRAGRVSEPSSRPLPDSPSNDETRHRLASEFASAVERSGVHTERFELAGLVVELRFAGRELLGPLHRALAHHRRIPGVRLGEARPVQHGPELNVHVWDAHACGTALPAYPPAAIDGGVTGAQRVGPRPDMRCRYQPELRVLSLLDHVTGDGWYCAADHAELPWWEHAAPMRHLLSWWLADHGRWLVHGAAVSRPRPASDGHDAVLLMARGGSGKSSTSLACLEAGMGFLGDDYCVVIPDPADPTVHSLYGTAKVRHEQVAAFPDLAGHLLDVAPDADGKSVLLVAEAHPELMVHSARLAHLLVPEITGRPATRLTSRAPSSTLTAAAPSTILQLPGAGADAFAALRAMVDAVPGHTLHLGIDRFGIVRTIEELLHGPLVSVIVPVFNGERFVTDALRSIALDGYRPLEVVVVDDGSTDASAECIERARAEWFTTPDCTLVHLTQANGGVANARNSAMATITGVFVAFCDQDDEFTVGRLARQVGYLQGHPDTDLVLGRQTLALEHPLTEWPAWVRHDPVFNDPGGILPLSMMVRREAFDRAGPFDESISGADDFDLWVRLRSAGFRHHVLPDVVLLRRIHDANASHTQGLISAAPMHAIRKHLATKRAAAQAAAAPASVASSSPVDAPAEASHPGRRST